MKIKFLQMIIIPLALVSCGENPNNEDYLNKEDEVINSYDNEIIKSYKNQSVTVKKHNDTKHIAMLKINDMNNFDLESKYFIDEYSYDFQVDKTKLFSLSYYETFAPYGAIKIDSEIIKDESESIRTTYVVNSEVFFYPGSLINNNKIFNYYDEYYFANESNSLFNMNVKKTTMDLNGEVLKPFIKTFSPNLNYKADTYSINIGTSVESNNSVNWLYSFSSNYKNDLSLQTQYIFTIENRMKEQHFDFIYAIKLNLSKNNETKLFNFEHPIKL